MQHRRVLLVDAFAEEPYAGNPAGVVLDAEGLSPGQMQTIAAEIGASETAFLTPSSRADRRIRYFTPTTEVDLCGHATIASLLTLDRTGEFEPGDHRIETNVGVLDVTVTESDVAWMTQSSPDVDEVDLPYEMVAEALGVDEVALEEVGNDLPLARASTGLPFLVVPVAFLENLGGADPDFAAIEALAKAVDAEGVYAFTFDTIDAESTIHGRAFVPGAGVPEDPVTGTASGATGAYLRAFDAFDEMPEQLIVEQGHFVDRPGRVYVRVGEAVEVGGRATVVLDGRITEPESDEDGIIEV
ncbi:MAG: PhzF family phenazine biosynthesis protein [Halodesulfurarchaeum sp.]